ncbi:C40 family peptidase [Deinococcus radiodurans]|jgi:Cell wall-associated hydrolases (invasion-associated proteins)|uniref:Endopeptidase-related protein n=1 Tax=Deinococcus radiodurans (strain ATCC 13939 / DSM 20539 / JCM 16871 / CCUG 27074 / LMG 4051 / NBRC 15346 / NCIMB 9279 / VKM B-1422 / R1) TaxID=243230 RepID=Q9RUQ7_DEIRA|nr:C40 family peptidase [Deinococcus radiodurans]AAF10897.1 endopeptidase-related protein [Deinococcus radiodurans R1 = ATCC 13939 = DSM 20539]ANC71520.1 peptidase [Deinococcus radiodurans R1 = ATCC 13939 = DSM 20539]QEM70792.1 LysM peptidoglycan-binding domain-containing protein [Deinococcus radiodurans]QIP29368.1 LysM peptidoglycan-binding domain-containing protein [Deinococcus radiodurans]QIP31937.1 LysM peptidoglycan-binding domain-containing protein [Deinococcus radiodurans]
MTQVAARFRFSIFASLLTTLILSGEVKAQTAQLASSPEATLTVQRGDTAYSIARRNGLTVDLLLAYNNLASPDIEVGQVLRLRPPTHTAQRGDTIYGLSRMYGVSVDALLAANTLPRDTKLEVGQVLQLPVGLDAAAPMIAAPAAPLPSPSALGLPSLATVAQGSQSETDSSGASWYQNAMSLLGTPYVLGGTSRKGIDCSGFVLQVMTPLGVKLPRRSADQARAGVSVDDDDLRPGDLLFFDTVGAGSVTHVGIYLGNDSFINANSYYGKVVVDKFKSDKYWSTRYLGARRVMMDALANY